MATGKRVRLQTKVMLRVQMRAEQLAVVFMTFHVQRDEYQ